MSIDYPNREDWLKVRSTPRKQNRERYIHISKPLVMMRDSNGSIEIVVSPLPGKTYRRMR